MSSTVLVTGVPGWLSQNLIDTFLRGEMGSEYQRMRCLVAPWEKSKTPKVNSDKVEFVYADLLDESAIKQALVGVEAVIHTAGIIHVKRVSDWYRVNFEGTKILMNAALAAGAKRFVYLSSNAAAGRSEDGHLLSESENPKPLSHYGKSKLQAEQFVLSLKDKIHVAVLRPCMFYGPPVPGRHVDFFRRVKFGTVPVVGSGNYPRSMIHVENLAQACWLALKTPSANGEVFYIADDEIYTVNEFVGLIADTLGVKPKYFKLPSVVSTLSYWGDLTVNALGLYQQELHLVGEANWSVGVSVEKAKRLLGYQPKRKLKEGMIEAIRWTEQQGLLR